MGYTFSFADDTAYSAEDINNITKRLVTSGIADSFTDGTPYNVKTLNVLTKNIAEKGVVPESNDTLRVTKVSNGKLKILPGTAFMESGATFTVDFSGVELDYSITSDNYVYIEDNESLNEIRPVVSDSLPVSYDYVLLAFVTYNGVITDKRKFAKGKLPGYMSDFNTPVRTTVDINGEGTYEIDIGRSVYNFVMITEKYENLSYYDYDALGIWNKYDEKYISVSCYNKGMYTSNQYFYLRPHYTGTPYMLYVSMSFEGTLIKLNVTKSSSSSNTKTQFVLTVF